MHGNNNSKTSIVVISVQRSVLHFNYDIAIAIKLIYNNKYQLIALPKNERRAP